MNENVRSILANDLGSSSFREEYKVKYSYMSGAMYKGIASKELVIRMAKAGLLGVYGSAGLSFEEIETGIKTIQSKLTNGETFGVNLLSSPSMPFLEHAMVDLLLRLGIKVVEASAYIKISAAIVKYRLTGLRRNENGVIQSDHRVIAKISRPEVALAFLNPAPVDLVNQLLANNQVTPEQAEMAKEVPVATDICVESDSGGHTDMGVATTLVPTIKRLRDEICQLQSYRHTVHLGVGGGIGTPEAAAAMFILGADFIVTGSINQCSVEAGISDDVKDMLQEINVQDTDYAPAGDMFEIGARVQVMKRGTFFAARANKLYELWKSHGSLDQIDPDTIKQIEKKYFQRSVNEVYEETKAYYQQFAPYEIIRAEKEPKHKMALVFRWYFIHTSRLARTGDEKNRVNYQVHTGPALGAFNQWIKGSTLENWRNRHVDEIGIKLMQATAVYLEDSISQWPKI